MEILQNFSTINNSIVIKQGNVVSTISPMKTIVARATVDISFPSSFAIYSLNGFLSAVSLFNDAELTVLESSMKIEGNENGKHREINYTFSEPSLIIQPPEKRITLPSVDVEFNLENDDLKLALKAASVIGSKEFALTGDNESVYLEAIDTKDKTANSYRTKVGDTDKKFRIVFLVENFKLLPRNYKVEICAKGLSRFSSDDLEYFIAIEASASSFGE